MRLEDFIERNDMLTEGIFQNLLKKISNVPANVLKKIFKDNWIKLAYEIENKQLEGDAIAIINKHLKTNYKSLNQITMSQIKELPVNEDFAHYWELIKNEAFPTFAFYPALKIWLELDKLLSGGGFNKNVVIVYAVFWALLVSGKYAKSWFDWKKKNPKEYEKEKHGKKRVAGFI
uniref:Uncharacterized protein n=1 Tax=viral metagenome TaxID=1070528 RepID=A0A6M3JNS6_9ZZZZ